MKIISKIYFGNEYEIYAITVRNKCYFQEFIDELEESEQKKIIKLLQYTAEHGRPNNQEKFKKLDEGIWEFKSYQVRILCFFDRGKIIVLTHGFKKKSGKTPKNEIEVARRLRSDYFSKGK